MDFMSIWHCISSLFGCRQLFDTKALRKMRINQNLSSFKLLLLS